MKTMDSTYHLQHDMVNSNYLMDQILYQISNIILSSSSKSMKYWLISLQYKISATLKVELHLNKAGYHPEYLAHETEKLLYSIGTKIIKDKNSENVPYLEITEVVLVNCNVANDNFWQVSRVCIHLIKMNKSINK